VKIEDLPEPISFDKYGKQRKLAYGGANLCEAEWLEQQIAEGGLHLKKQRAVKNLLVYIDGWRCGNGNYDINDDNKDEIKRLVDAIFVT